MPLLLVPSYCSVVVVLLAVVAVFLHALAAAAVHVVASVAEVAGCALNFLATHSITERSPSWATRTCVSSTRKALMRRVSDAN